MLFCNFNYFNFIIYKIGNSGLSYFIFINWCSNLIMNIIYKYYRNDISYSINKKVSIHL